MLLATHSLPHEAVALSHTLQTLPDIVVEAERIAAHSTRWTMPCLWIAADDFAEVDEALDADPSVEAVVDADEFADEKYYTVSWAEAVEERVNTYVDEHGSILEAHGTGDGWRLSCRFVSREQLRAFRAYLVDHDHSFELLALTEQDAPRQSVGGLTPTQRQALVAAVEQGYFRVPREISQAELAEQLGVAPGSLSEVLRRGTENLVTATLRIRGTTDPV